MIKKTGIRQSQENEMMRREEMKTLYANNKQTQTPQHVYRRERETASNTFFGGSQTSSNGNTSTAHSQKIEDGYSLTP